MPSVFTWGGAYWIAHHRMFGSIIRYNTTLLWLNLTLLLSVVFLPFPTYLLDKYTNSIAITAFYAATLSVISLCSILIWEYAAFRHRLIPPDLDEKTILSNRGSGWITLALFVLSIGLAFLSPLLARISWFAIFFMAWLLLHVWMTRRSLRLNTDRKGKDGSEAVRRKGKAPAIMGSKERRFASLKHVSLGRLRCPCALHDECLTLVTDLP